MSSDIGDIFPDDGKKEIRLFWAVTGVSAGFIGVGGAYHWSMNMASISHIPPIYHIIVGAVMLFGLLELQKRRNWDV